MNLSQIIDEVNKDIDDSLDSADITGWINRALDDLTPFAKHQKSTTISLIKDQKEYSNIPVDLVEIIHVIDEINSKSYHQIGMADFVAQGFKRWGNKLVFQPAPSEDGELSMYYHARLPHLKNGTDTPDIPEQFHDLLVLYAVAKAKYQDEEESMQHNAMQEYYTRREQFITYQQSGETYQIQEVSW